MCMCIVQAYGKLVENVTSIFHQCVAAICQYVIYTEYHTHAHTLIQQTTRYHN